MRYNSPTHVASFNGKTPTIIVIWHWCASANKPPGRIPPAGIARLGGGDPCFEPADFGCGQHDHIADAATDLRRPARMPAGRGFIAADLVGRFGQGVEGWHGLYCML